MSGGDRAHRLFVVLATFFVANALLAEFIGVKIFALEGPTLAATVPSVPAQDTRPNRHASPVPAAISDCHSARVGRR